MRGAAEVLALVDRLAGERVLVAGSLPPDGRDLDLLVRPRAERALAAGLAAAGFHARGGVWARDMEGGAQEVELIPAADWGLAPAELAALYERALPLGGTAHVVRPAPHDALLVIAFYASGGPLPEQRLRRARAAVAEDPCAPARARALAGAWGVEGSLAALEARLAGTVESGTMPSSAPALVLHVIATSHPSRAAEAALRHKGLDFERVVLVPGEHNAEMERIYGEGKRTVPGLLLDGEPVHGSIAIFERLEALAPDPPLYPDPIAAAVRAAERWADEELQPLGRRLPFGALHFRPEAMGTFGGGGPLNPAGTDFAIRFLRGSWRYHGITAERLAADLEGLPAKLDHLDELVVASVLGGEQPTAADLHIGATVRVLLTVGDLRPLLAGRTAEAIARRWFPDYPGDVPAGAFPAGWVPARSGSG